MALRHAQLQEAGLAQIGVILERKGGLRIVAEGALGEGRPHLVDRGEKPKRLLAQPQGPDGRGRGGNRGDDILVH